jgi:hypothetical protein
MIVVNPSRPSKSSCGNKLSKLPVDPLEIVPPELFSSSGCDGCGVVVVVTAAEEKDDDDDEDEGRD